MKPTRRPLKIALIAVAAVIVIIGGAGAILIARFNPNTYKPDIIEAVKNATGRDLTLNGKIGLTTSLWPTIQMEGVAFSNPPGFSRPQMATLQRMDLQVALLPLLSGRIEIDHLTLFSPNILLERDAAGQPNWQLNPKVSPSAPAGSQAPVKSGRVTTTVSVDTIRIQDGTVAYRDDKTGHVVTLGLTKLVAQSASPDSPLHIDADASYNGTAFKLIADTGSLTRLQDPSATTAWPLKATLTALGATLKADGSTTQPLLGKDYELAVNGSIPDLAALAPLLPGYAPPPLHDVHFTANLVDKNGAVPAFSTLTLHVGASDLGSIVPGLTLDKLDVDAPKADQPIKAEASGKLADMPLALAGTFGPLAQLLPNAKPAPFPVDVTLQAASATASAKGSIANARAMTGANIAVAAQIPDLSALSPLARRPLPAVMNVAFQATLADAAGGFTHGVTLQNLHLSSPAGDLAGNAAVQLATRDALTVALTSNRIDLDTLQAAIGKMPPAPPPAPQAGAPPPPPPKPRGDHLFSRQPIPFDQLRAADADINLSLADVHVAGADYKAITTHAVLKDGKLTVDPIAGDLPGGRLQGTLSADATQAAVPVHLTLHAPGLPLKTILAAIHQPPYATGNLDVYADLGGTGATPHAIASSLDGSLGLAVAGGTIDNRLLGSLLGKVLNSLNALDLVGKGGTSELKCFATRIDAAHGVAAVKALALSSSLLTMTGLGTVNLGNETLAMALRPQARVAGTGLTIPIAVSGPIRDPSVKVNDLGAAEANAGTVAGTVIGDATPLGIVGGLFGADKLLGGGKSDICTPALAAARGQAVPEAAPAKAEQPIVSKPETFLKNLFR